MAKHESKVSGNGHYKLDVSKAKDVRESGSGKHSDEDKGDQGKRDDQDQQK